MKEKTIENAWSILLKFGKEENLQKLQAGQFYMKNLQYYVDLPIVISITQGFTSIPKAKS